MTKSKRKRKQVVRQKQDLKKFVTIATAVTLIVLLLLYLSFKAG